MRTGRPREFDANLALEAALQLFWKHGYEGTSMAMLADAMGVNPPSIYVAFGNKESLFKQALNRYLEKPASYLRQALEKPIAREVVESALQGAIDMTTKPKNPDGCLLVHGALACHPDAEMIRQELAVVRSRAETRVRQRFEQAIGEGDWPKDADAGQLAQYLMTVIWGLSVQASGGASRKQLQATAELALKAFPGALR